MEKLMNSPCECCNALWIKFRLTEDLTLSDGTADAVVYVDAANHRCYWQGDDPDPNDLGFPVYNLEAPSGSDSPFQFSGSTGDIGIACLDDSNPSQSQYRIVYIGPPGTPTVIASTNSELEPWDNEEYQNGCEIVSGQIVEACGTDHDINEMIDIIFIRVRDREPGLPSGDYVVCAPVDKTANPPLYIAVSEYLKPKKTEPSVIVALNAAPTAWDNDAFENGCESVSGEVIASCGGAEHLIGETVDVIFTRVRGLRPVVESGDWVGAVQVNGEADPKRFTVTTDYTTIDPGCGLQITEEGLLEVDTEALAGKGLKAAEPASEEEGTCELEVEIACGLKFIDNEIWVDNKAIKGPGLVEYESCGLQVNPGCGIRIDDENDEAVAVDAADLAGNGLKADEEGCLLHIDYGCGLRIEEEKLEFYNMETAGPGLKAGSGCELEVNPGCGLQIDGDDLIEVNNKDLAGKGLLAGEGCGLDIDLGCGLIFSGNEIWFDNKEVAGPGLMESGSCSLQVNPGCGIKIDESDDDAVAVDPSDLAGDGLKAGESGCLLHIDFGCGLDVEDGKLVVDNKALAGDGLEIGSDCELKIKAGCGLEINEGTLEVNNKDLVGAGLQVSGTCGLKIVPGCGVKIGDDEGDILEVDNEDLAGDGLKAGSGCKLEVDYGCGLDIDGGTLVIDSKTLAGDGLSVSGTCSLKVDTGCGLETAEGKVQVDNTAIAGKGLTAGADCAVDVNPGCGITISGGQVAVDNADLIGPGLIQSGTCGLQVNPGCGISVTSGKVTVNNAAIAGNGLKAGTNCSVDIRPGCGIKTSGGEVVLDFSVNGANSAGISFDEECFEVATSGTCPTSSVSLKTGVATQQVEYVYDVECSPYGDLIIYTRYMQFSSCGLFLGSSDKSL